MKEDACFARLGGGGETMGPAPCQPGCGFMSEACPEEAAVWKPCGGTPGHRPRLTGT